MLKNMIDGATLVKNMSIPKLAMTRIRCGFLMFLPF
jgi:hypothetical protein